MEDLVPEPPSGRRFRTGRGVYLGDADPSGRLRLDALARLLQDVGNDDFVDAGQDVNSPWVARRVVVEAERWPQLGDRLRFTTWLGGLGGRWAERRSSVRTEGGGQVEVGAVWVNVAGGRPTKIPDWFVETWGEGAQGRSVSARLVLPPPPATGVDARPWPLRASDLDVLGHVNNASTWSAVEDELARRHLVARRAELEYGAAIDPGDDVTLRSSLVAGVLSLWLVVDGDVRAAARVVAATG